MDTYLAQLNRKYHQIKPKPRRDLEQYSVDLTGVFLRSREILAHHRSGRALMVGDDDLTSLFLANHPIEITVLEKDQRTIDVLRNNLPPGARVEIIPSEFRDVYDDKWPEVRGPMDFFVTSPPYTQEGMKIWVAIGIRALKVGGMGFIASPYDASPKADMVTVETMKFVLANNCIIEKVLPGLTIEEGLPAYQIMIRKLGEVDRIDWVKKLEGKLYEWDEFGGQDAYDHQINS